MGKKLDEVTVVARVYRSDKKLVRKRVKRLEWYLEAEREKRSERKMAKMRVRKKEEQKE